MTTWCDSSFYVPQNFPLQSQNMNEMGVSRPLWLEQCSGLLRCSSCPPAHYLLTLTHNPPQLLYSLSMKPHIPLCLPGWISFGASICPNALLSLQ